MFQLMNGVGLGMLYFLLAVGLSIIFGLLHFVNFAHGAFYLLGAYLCYAFVESGLGFWGALVFAPLVVALFAGAVEAGLLRRIYRMEHMYHIVATIGLALAIQELVIIVWGPLGSSGASPPPMTGAVILGNFISPAYRRFVIGFATVLADLLRWLLDGSRLGAVVRAGSESSDRISLLGHDIKRINTAVFALG